MDVAGVDVIRRVGFSLQNNSGVIVCDKLKNEQNCNGILCLKKKQKNKKQNIAFVSDMFVFKSVR